MASTSSAVRAFFVALLAGTVGMGSYAMTTGPDADGDSGTEHSQQAQHSDEAPQSSSRNCAWRVGLGIGASCPNSDVG